MLIVTLGMHPTSFLLMMMLIASEGYPKNFEVKHTIYVSLKSLWKNKRGSPSAAKILVSLMSSSKLLPILWLNLAMAF